jgi:hypothetical protein
MLVMIIHALGVVKGVVVVKLLCFYQFSEKWVKNGEVCF